MKVRYARSRRGHSMWVGPFYFGMVHPTTWGLGADAHVSRDGLTAGLIAGPVSVSFCYVPGGAV